MSHTILPSRSRKLICLIVALFAVLPAFAASEQTAETQKDDDILFPQLDRPLSLSHFTWGIDVGSSIDLGGNDMSTFDAEAMFGYKNSLWQALGVGAGVHKAFGNEYTFVPVFALVRTSFRNKPSLFFLDARAGYSFNTISDAGSQGGFIFSLGAGINLSLYKGIKSHIIISYSYYGLKEAADASVPYKGHNIDYAMLRIGVSF